MDELSFKCQYGTHLNLVVADDCIQLVTWSSIAHDDAYLSADDARRIAAELLRIADFLEAAR